MATPFWVICRYGEETKRSHPGALYRSGRMGRWSKSNLSRGSYLVVIVAFAITLVTFTALVVYTPQNLGVRISKEHAQTTVEQSAKVDSRIVSDSAPTNVELRWMKLDWRTLDWVRVGHQHIFLADIPAGDIGPFWLLEYQKRIDDSGDWLWLFTGRYIVDADSGRLVASVEKTYHNPPDPTSARLDYYVTSNPEKIYEPMPLGVGETLTIDIIAKAYPSYDASLPLTFRVINLRSDLTVTQNATTAILRSGGVASIRFSILKSSAYVSSPFPNPSYGFEIEVSDIFGGGNSVAVYITT